MKQWVSVISCCLGWVSAMWSELTPVDASASSASSSSPTVVYTRNGNLWMTNAAGEKQITTGERVTGPIWSSDGQWLAYQSDAPGSTTIRLLWVYNIKTQTQRLISRAHSDSEHPAFIYGWSPTLNLLAVQSGNAVNVVDLSNRNSTPATGTDAAVGVGRFSWLPDGTGLLVSSPAQLLPDGWTNSILYKIPLRSGDSGKDMRRFFVVPERVKSVSEVYPIGTSTFKWSYDGRWIAFIAHPTADISADRNILCVLSADGKRFIPVGEMLNFTNWFAWAPSTDVLGYIAGGGRFHTENKVFAVALAPDFSSRVITSPDFADSSFTWNDDQTITVSRQLESVGESQSGTGSLPGLYRVTVQRGRPQQRITTPPAGFGDVDPVAVPQTHTLVWMRFNHNHSDVWVSHEDGTAAHPLVQDVDFGSLVVYVKDVPDSNRTTSWR